MDIERSCKNCNYYPCTKKQCDKVCEQHKFEHEVMIEKLKSEVEI